MGGGNSGSRNGVEDVILEVEEYGKASPGEPLEIVGPVDNVGRFTDVVKECAGQHVLKANPKIVEFLQANGRLLGHGSLNHSYPHCWRCKNPVIFRATEQWFVSMETNDLRKEALAEIDRVRWIPAYGRDRINGMVENRPDWCVARPRVGGVGVSGVGGGRRCVGPQAGWQRALGGQRGAGPTCHGWSASRHPWNRRPEVVATANPPGGNFLNSMLYR